MTWYCTWCGKPHDPDSRQNGYGAYTQPDQRYALAECHGTRRTLIQDKAQAELASRTMGKYRKPSQREPVKADQFGPGYKPPVSTEDDPDVHPDAADL
jgi:hypothetical protein